MSNSSYSYKINLKLEEKIILEKLSTKGYAKAIYESPHKALYGRYKLRKALHICECSNLVSTSVLEDVIYLWMVDKFGHKKINPAISLIIDEDLETHITVEEEREVMGEVGGRMLAAMLEKKLGIKQQYKSFEAYLKDVKED